LDDSFKRNAGLLDIIKEDRGDDDQCKYADDFEPIEHVCSPVEIKQVPPPSLPTNLLLDKYLNPRSAEPYLHKSKVQNL
jgi:hypothetical protein